MGGGAGALKEGQRSGRAARERRRALQESACGGDGARGPAAAQKNTRSAAPRRPPGRACSDTSDMSAPRDAFCAAADASGRSPVMP